MRDLLVFAIVILSLPTSIRRPFIGLLVFSWLAYMRPQDLCWGFARSMRLSFFVGVAMIAGWWANEQGRRPFARWDVRTTLMAALAFMVTVSYVLAGDHDSLEDAHYFDYLKIVIVALFTTAQVDSPQRLRAMYWTIALSLGFFGIKNGLFGILRGGATIQRGPGGMLEDNNDFALALTMNVPLLWYLGLAETKNGYKWARSASLVAVGLTVVTIVLTHSRGAFLALTATALWIAWRSGRLFRAVLVLATLAAIFLLVAPPEVLERLRTIGDTQESSAASRLRSWGIALSMIADNPVFGVGLRNFQDRYAEYAGVTEGTDISTHVAHNSYLQIWAESGSIAFFLGLSLLAATMYSCRRVFRLSRLRPDLAWLGNYARMMEATTIGFMVGAFFLDRGHFDLIYTWFALATCLVAVSSQAARAAPVVAGAPLREKGRITVGWRGAGAFGALPAQVLARLPRWR